MSDFIRCDCDNRFHVFEKCYEQRLMSCIKCRKVWRIGCSGRRLYSVSDTLLAQWIERLPTKQKVTGSSPVEGAPQ